MGAGSGCFVVFFEGGSFVLGGVVGSCEMMVKVVVVVFFFRGVLVKIQRDVLHILFIPNGLGLPPTQ